LFLCGNTARSPEAFYLYMDNTARSREAFSSKNTWTSYRNYSYRRYKRCFLVAIVIVDISDAFWLIIVIVDIGIIVIVDISDAFW
jgi:hypothetical protein